MKDKIEEIKKEFDIKINNCFGDKPSGFKLCCYECDSSVDIKDLWEWIEEKLSTLIQEERKEAVEGFITDFIETGVYEGVGSIEDIMKLWRKYNAHN